MEGAIAGIVREGLNRRTKTQEIADIQLLSEIESVRQSLDMVTASFDYQDDPDLLEACIYEMQALTARYRYLTREARRLGLKGNSLMTLKRLETK